MNCRFATYFTSVMWHIYDWNMIFYNNNRKPLILSFGSWLDCQNWLYIPKTEPDLNASLQRMCIKKVNGSILIWCLLKKWLLVSQTQRLYVLCNAWKYSLVGINSFHSFLGLPFKAQFARKTWNSPSACVLFVKLFAKPFVRKLVLPINFDIFVLSVFHECDQCSEFCFAV